ncbi:hypothetical protein IAT38_004066 [Cryptococcus sp. DSM 104549]
MKYMYTLLAHFFALSEWAADIKGPFSLCPPRDWHAFKTRIEELNGQCPDGESIKVIYVARHGQAEHNVIKQKYGASIEAVRVGDKLIKPSVHVLHPIPDPSLTPLGRSQASAIAATLQREVARGMPLPEKWFVSPLKRVGETCGIEWGWAFGNGEETVGKSEEGENGEHKDRGRGVPGVVTKNLRERLHVNECDKRSPLSALRKLFPSFTFPPSAPDEDALWEPGTVRGRETQDEIIVRAQMGIVECLELSEGATYISVTSHGQLLLRMYTALGLPSRKLEVGEMNVLVLRVKKVEE